MCVCVYVCVRACVSFTTPLYPFGSGHIQSLAKSINNHKGPRPYLLLILLALIFKCHSYSIFFYLLKHVHSIISNENGIFLSVSCVGIEVSLSLMAQHESICLMASLRLSNYSVTFTINHSVAL